MKARAAVIVALSLLMSIPAITQTCSTTQYKNTLICTLPQLYGPSGLTLPNPNHDAHFAGASENLFAIPLNQSIGQELSILPLGSSGSGTTFTLDSQGHPKPTEDSLGPILTERANVIGRKAVSIGFAYQHFNFSHIDGIRLTSFPAVLTHLGWTDKLNVGTSAAPVFKQDYIKTSNEIHLELNQAVIYAVFGLTNRMDASIEVPIQSAHLRVVSNAHIARTQPCESQHNCAPLPGEVDQAECGEFHYFEGYQDSGPPTCPTIYTSVDKAFPNPGIAFSMIDIHGNTINVPMRPQGSPLEDAKGIGDITLRGKYELLHGERFTGSVGLGVRFPSGDANNFLGTGAYGVIPFGAITARTGRLSPHARFGYEWNSHSILAGNPSGIDQITEKAAPTTASLPAAWLYSFGADYRAQTWLTFAADLIGQRVLDVRRLTLKSYSLLPETDGTTDPSNESKGPIPSILINPSSSSYSSDSVALGAKIRLKKELVLIGNATMRVDDGGLRANVVPLVGLSYAF
jgi:hypothetical protein